MAIPILISIIKILLRILDLTHIHSLRRHEITLGFLTSLLQSAKTQKINGKFLRYPSLSSGENGAE